MPKISKMKAVLIFGAAFLYPAFLLGQDISLEATFGSISLSSGFSSDPRTYSITSGGSINASSLGGGCVGYIANAPDFQLDYDAGSLPLWLTVASDSDVTLVVNLPNGSWICDDDSGDGLDPSLYFSSPMSGVYDIWIGTYSSSSYESGVLYISELGAYGG